MRKIVINTPLWNGRKVGIADKYIDQDIVVEILVKDKYGNKIYPHYFSMDYTKAKSYPIEKFNRTPELRIIPIDDFHVMTQDERDKFEYDSMFR